MNNKILSLALAISQVMRSFLVFILIVLAVLGVILIADNEALPFLRYDAGSFIFSQGNNESGYRPEGWFMFILFFKLSLSIACSVLILGEAIKVISSLKTLTTFRKENIKAFRKMGYIFLVLFVINMLSIIQNATGLEMRFSLPLNYLLAVIGCFVLSEIFKEGNKLMEENNLTI